VTRTSSRQLTTVTVSDPLDSSRSSPGLTSSNRRSVEEAQATTAITELPEGVPEHHLLRFTAEVDAEPLPDSSSRADSNSEDDSPAAIDAVISAQRSPPPQYPASEEGSAVSSAFRPPPPFSSLFSHPGPDPEAAASILEPFEPFKSSVADADNEASAAAAAPAYAPRYQVVPESSSRALAATQFQDETKRALPQDTKGESSRNAKDDEAEPPPAYSEGSSPLQSFTYLMAAAGGASSIITQVQQGGPPINTLGGEHVCRKLRRQAR